VAPGLYKKEKRLIFPILTSSVAMFALGMVYCYFIVFRMVFQFIAGFSPDSVNFAPDIDAYFGFVISMFIAFGLTFEVPIVVMVLNRIGLATKERLVKMRPYVIVGAFVIAAIVTPPDVLSQCLLALPLVILYQVGVWLVQLFGKKDEPSDE
jgi:sec-independent protein translocase protein TatC